MRNLLCMILLLNTGITTAQYDKTYSSKKQRWQFYTDLANKYSSAGVKEILFRDKSNEFEYYIDGPSEKQLVESYSTVIHELLHGYNRTENGGNYYFIEPGVRIFVPLTEVYRSKELNSFVRAGQQDSIFRYGIYVGARSEIPGHKHLKGINDSERNEAASIQQGIYGLLEEFSAYYYGDLAAYEMYDYYLKQFGEVNNDTWKDYKHEVQSDALAYYEFNLFFGWYMVYAKAKHPAVYKGIVENKPFRVVYTLMQNKFAALIKKAEEQLQVIAGRHKPDAMDILDFSGSEEDVFRFLEVAGLPKEQIYKETTKVVNGKTVTVKEALYGKEEMAGFKDLYMDAVKQVKEALGSDMNMFFAQPMRQIEWLKKQMTPEMQKEVNQLLLTGVTPGNYQSFMK